MGAGGDSVIGSDCKEEVAFMGNISDLDQAEPQHFKKRLSFLTRLMPDTSSKYVQDHKIIPSREQHNN